MPDAFGYNAHIGVAEEVTWGTPVAAALYNEFESESVGKEIDQQESRSVRSLSETRRQDFGIQEFGDLTMEGIFQGHEKYWKHLFGTVVDSVLVVNAHNHRFTLADALPVGLTLEVYKGDDFGGTPESFQAAGCKVVSATMTMEPNDPLMVAFSSVGSDEAFITRTSPTFPDLSGVLLVKGHHMTCEIDDVVTTIDNAELTIDNGLVTDKRVMGLQTIAQPKRGASRRIVTGTFKADWQDTVNYLKFINGTTAKLEFIFTSILDMPTQAGSKFSLRFTLPKVKFDGKTPTVSEIGLLKQELPFHALSAGSGILDSVYLDIDNELATA